MLCGDCCERSGIQCGVMIVMGGEPCHVVW